METNTQTKHIAFCKC